jgi:chromate transporter
VRWLGFSFEIPLLASVDPLALLLTIGAAFALFRFGLGAPRTLALCTAAGGLLFIFGAAPAAARTFASPESAAMRTAVNYSLAP